MSPPSRTLSLALFSAAMLFASSVAAQHGHGMPHGNGQSCLQPATWAVLEGAKPRPEKPGTILADMASHDVVLLGEQHDDDDHHRWQVQTLAALHALRPDMVIGFEQFPRRVQPVLDRWVAGELSVKDFLREVEWDEVWNMPAELYLPLFQFARLNRIPMVALNVERSLNKAVIEKGWDAVPEAAREGVGRPAEPSASYRNYLQEIYRQHVEMRAKAREKAKDKGDASQPEVPFEHFVQSQLTWDRAMAEALAARLARGNDAAPLVVGIMGSGHIRYGFGVPHQLRDLGVSKVASLLPISADEDCAQLHAGFADAVFAVPGQALSKPEPPRLGVRLEEHEGAVRIAEVTPGSLADKSGLRGGDRLLEVAGVTPDRIPLVVAQVRQQPGGTWLPMRIRRGEDTLDLVVKFPVKQ